MVFLVFSLVTPAYSNTVVIERDQFVNILSGVTYLEEKLKNLNKQLDLLSSQIKIQDEKISLLVEEINELEIINEGLKSQTAVYKEDNERLEKKLKSTDTWSDVKTYAIIIIGALLVGTVIVK